MAEEPALLPLRLRRQRVRGGPHPSTRPAPSLTGARSPRLRRRRGRSLTRPRSLPLCGQRAPSLTGALPLGLTFVLGPDRFRTTLGGVGFCRALHLPEQVSVVLKRCSEIEVLGSKGTFEERQRTL